MIKEKIKHRESRTSRAYASLRLTMLSNVFFALGVAVLVFFVSKFFFNMYIENTYMSDEKKTERIEEYKEDLQKFVTENGLGSGDTKKISEWAKKNKYLYVLIYQDDKLLFESGQYDEENDPEMGENKENADDEPGNSVENDGDGNEENTGDTGAEGADPGLNDGDGSDPDVNNGADTPEGEGDEGLTDGSGSSDKGNESTDKDDNKYPSTGITVKTPTRDELIAEAVARGSHPIVTSDGVLLASMVDYTEYLYIDIFNIISLALALVGFMFVMWLYFYEITKRITRLGKEVTSVADGELERTITSDGDDEITRLCSDVEYMRSSMLENIEKEHAALESNRELITAMSHDIRTPLTVLLGYLDIMKLNAPEGDMQQYIEASERTALRLKKMSDDMFSYFLAYGGAIEVSVQECDARTLIDQMLSGHVFLLREQGYNIEFNFESEDNDFLSRVIVVTDPPQLMRIVENIFSNIMKYADKEKAISIFVGAETDELTIKVSNYVALNPDLAQKNGIGLRSCMKLANAMDVRFSSGEEDGIFTSLMHVPIIPIVSYKETEDEEEGGIIGWFRSILSKLVKFSDLIQEKIKKYFLKRK